MKIVLLFLILLIQETSLTILVLTDITENNILEPITVFIIFLIASAVSITGPFLLKKCFSRILWNIKNETLAIKILRYFDYRIMQHAEKYYTIFFNKGYKKTFFIFCISATLFPGWLTSIIGIQMKMTFKEIVLPNILGLCIWFIGVYLISMGFAELNCQIRYYLYILIIISAILWVINFCIKVKRI